MMGLLQDNVAALVREGREKAEAEARQAVAVKEIHTTRLNELASLLFEDAQFLREHSLCVRDGSTGEIVRPGRETWTGPLILTGDKLLVAVVSFDTVEEVYNVDDWGGCEPGPDGKPIEQKVFRGASTCVAGIAELLVKYTNVGTDA